MNLLRSLLIAAVCLAAVVPAAFAQQGNITAAAAITNTARVPGTSYAVGTTNSSDKGVQCTFNQASEVGNPSTVMTVEVEDANSGTWQSVGASTAVSAATAATRTLQVYPGIATSSLPTGVDGVNLKVGAIWRLKQVITGGTSTTGSSACQLLN